MGVLRARYKRRRRTRTHRSRVTWVTHASFSRVVIQYCREGGGGNPRRRSFAHQLCRTCCAPDVTVSPTTTHLFVLLGRTMFCLLNRLKNARMCTLRTAEKRYVTAIHMHGTGGGPFTTACRILPPALGQVTGDTQAHRLLPLFKNKKRVTCTHVSDYSTFLEETC